MGWLWAIIVGLVLGLLAKAIIPGKQHIPLWLTVILGMIGGIARQRHRAGGRCRGHHGASTGGGTSSSWSMAIILVGLGDLAYTAARGRQRQGKGLTGRTAKGPASGTGDRPPPARVQPPVTSTAARFFLPRRSTSQRPCSRSSLAGTASSPATFTLFT